MSKEYRPGFWYINSAELNQEVALSMESGWVYCEDKGPDGKLVNYSPEEMDILKNRGLKLAHDVHLIKKIFGGRIVNYDGKPDSIVNDTNTGGEIPETGEIGKNIRQGELDIY